MDGYLTKPVKVADLLQMLTEFSSPIEAELAPSLG
jgi:YesN/AraC family two-component response regulator